MDIKKIATILAIVFIAVGIILLSKQVPVSIKESKKSYITIGSFKIPKNASYFSIKLPFENNSRIPDIYTCKNIDVSPAIRFENLPNSTKSILVIVEDPDAPSGSFIHWILYIPDKLDYVPEALAKSDMVALENITLYQGFNDFGELGYRGPCPPPGKEHRYIFLALAFDKIFDIMPAFTKEYILNFLNNESTMNHIIGYSYIIGLFST